MKRFIALSYENKVTREGAPEYIIAAIDGIPSQINSYGHILRKIHDIHISKYDKT